MGAAFSEGNNVYVHTDKPTYVAGEEISGTVSLNVVTPLESKGVFLKIRGCESTFWQEKRERQVVDGVDDAGMDIVRTETFYEERRGLHSFFRVRVPVYPVRGMCEPGQYSFPFKFMLPRDLPGSFYEHGRRWETEYDARVRYTLKAEVDVAGFFKSDITHTQELIIHERVLGDIVPAVREKTQNVYVCCCFNKGSAAVRATLDKNCYAPGETAHIVAEIDNQSSVDFRRITVKLMRRLVIRAPGGRDFARTELVAENSYEGVPPHTSAVGDEARRVPLGLVHRRYGGIEPETHGRLITCEYWVVLDCDVAMGMDVQLEIPVTIYAPQPAVERWEPDLPPAWEPAVCEEVMVALDTPEFAY
eukprot:PLAT2790.1.p2 GENE.PLAT2790.1~~PLAT2790.1.p2  ORF type:complete len:375 (-),score=167.53 PLAT2790.1:123-1205(-)